MTTLSRSERNALCDLALTLGPEAPTLLPDWDVGDLMAHLFVREQSVYGAPGIAVPLLSGLTDRAMNAARAKEFTALVEKVRKPFSLFALPGVDPMVNTMEFFVHHEDVRRAQSQWEPRAFNPHDQAVLWKSARQVAKLMLRKAPDPISFHRTDTGVTVVVHDGPGEPVVVSGTPSELVLWLYGRTALRDVTFDGPDEAVARVQALKLGI